MSECCKHPDRMHYPNGGCSLAGCHPPNSSRYDYAFLRFLGVIAGIPILIALLICGIVLALIPEPPSCDLTEKHEITLRDGTRILADVCVGARHE